MVAQPPPPPPPAPVVELQNAPVVEFFGVPLEGVQDVVFVLDCSGSMSNFAQGRVAQLATPATDAAPAGGSAAAAPPYPPASATPADGAGSASPPPTPAQPRKIDVAQAELVDALQRLPVGTRMNVIFFNDDVLGFSPGAVPLDETSRATFITFVKGTAPSGNTALAPAMRTVFLMNPKRIVLLSDGLGNVGGGADAVLRDAREAMRGGVRIDTIGLGRGQDADLLHALARESGGLYQAL